MRKTIPAALALLLVSCAPQSYVLDIDMRYPSASGDDFVGKEMGVVYPGGGSDSLYYYQKALGLARTLEKDYFQGNQSIEIFDLPKDPEADYNCTDSLVSLVMQTGKDVVFLLEGDRVYYYDSMGQDKVKSVPMSDSGYSLLTGIWKNESYSVLYFEFGEWIDALQDAALMQWEQAAQKWMDLAVNNGNNMLRRSCAEYNVALACYMVGNYDLALQWLDASDSDYPISLSKGLRTRIGNRKEKAGR